MTKKKRIALDASLILVVGVVNLAPLLWAVLTSLKSERDVYAYPIKIFNFSPTFENYIAVMKNRFGDDMLNSAMYGVIAILACVLLSSMAGYAFSRFKTPLMKLFYTLVVFGIPLSVGSSALIVPNYIFFAKLGLVNKFITLPLVYTVYNLPMAVWIALGGLRMIPYEIEEAAIIDGCSKTRIIFGIMPLLNRPALACAALFVFIGSWNEFIVSAVLINSPNLRAIQVAVYDYMGYWGRQWGPLMAAAILALIPVIILFSFLGRQLISGLTAGATKG